MESNSNHGISVVEQEEQQQQQQQASEQEKHQLNVGSRVSLAQQFETTLKQMRASGVVRVVLCHNFLMTTYHYVMKISRSLNHTPTVTILAVAYADLVLLQLCLHSFKLTPSGSPWRGLLTNLAVWSLASALVAAVTINLAQVIPPPVAVVIWAMAAITGGHVFWVLFLRRDRSDGGRRKE